MKASPLLLAQFAIAITGVWLVPSTGFAIWGGTGVSEGDIIERSTVFIRRENEKGVGVCSGTLVDRDIIITAAHCVTEIGRPVKRFKGQIEVYFGVNPRLSRPLLKVRVTNFVYHPHFAGANRDGSIRENVKMNDIAILKIEEDLPNFAAPASIDFEEKILSESVSTVLAGYGPPSAPGDYVFYLRKLEKKISGYRGKTGQRFLADQKKSYTTSGDSGGPVYLLTEGTDRSTLVGIMSTKNSIEPIYMYAEWINEVISALR